MDAPFAAFADFSVVDGFRFGLPDGFGRATGGGGDHSLGPVTCAVVPGGDYLAAPAVAAVAAVVVVLLAHGGLGGAGNWDGDIGD